MFVLLVALSSPGIAFDENTPERLIERAVAARGEPKVKGEFAVRTTSKVHQAGVTVVAVQLILPPDRTRIEETWTEAGRALSHVVVYDSKQLWSKEAGVTREGTPRELDAVRAAINRGRVEALRELVDQKKYKLTLLPPAQVEGEECLVLKVEQSGSDALELRFSKKTSLLRMVAGKRIGQDLETVPFTKIMSEHKQFDGRMYATKIVEQIGKSPPVTTTVEKVEYVPATDATKLFTRP